jgi:histidine triad (HIT) family protein
MCIFCKISAKEIPSDVIFEDEQVIAFKDIRPIAPVHVLVIPKKHIESVANITAKEELLMGHLILVAKKIAKNLKIDEDGYKLLLRVGDHGGQEVPHIHLHLIGGAPLFEDIHPLKIKSKNLA